MRRLTAIPMVAAAWLALAPATPQQQKGVSTQTVKGYLDKMEMPSVPHPKSADTLVVPRTDNANADRIDLYVERRTDQTIKGYLDKMEMPSVPHPKSADTLVVPR